MSPRWPHRSFLTLLHLTWTSNYSWTRHHWENLQAWAWGWSTPASQNPRQSAWKANRAATGWPHGPSPRLAQHHTKRAPLSLWFLQWERRIQGATRPLAFWVAYWAAHPQGLRAVCEAQPLGIWLCQRSKGLAKTSTWILAMSSQLQCPGTSVLTSRTKPGIHPNRGTWQGGNLPDSDPQMSFASPRAARSTHAQARNRIAAPLGMNVSSGPIWTERAGSSSWKLCSPAVLELRGRPQSPWRVGGTGRSRSNCALFQLRGI